MQFIEDPRIKGRISQINAYLLPIRLFQNDIDNCERIYGYVVDPEKLSSLCEHLKCAVRIIDNIKDDGYKYSEKKKV